MPKVAKRSADLLVHESMRALDGRDSAGHAPGEPEVPSPPGHLVVEAQSAGRDARDRDLFRSAHRLGVQVNIKRQVESLLGRAVKFGDQLEDRHGASSALSGAMSPPTALRRSAPGPGAEYLPYRVASPKVDSSSTLD